MRKQSSSLLIGLLAVASMSLALADAPEQGTGAANPPASAPASDAATDNAISRFLLTPAFATLAVTGNNRRYDQYVSPPEQGYVAEVAAFMLAKDGKSLLDVDARNLGTTSAQGDLWWAMNHGGLVLRADQREATFFRDWTPDEHSTNREHDKVDLDARVGNGDVQLFTNTTEEHGVLTTTPVDWTGNMTGARYTTQLGTLLSSLNYTQDNFSSNQGSGFSGHADTFGARFSPRLTNGSTLDASASLTQTTLEGNATTPRQYLVALEGSRLLGANASLQGELTHSEITDTIIQNTYGRRVTNVQLASDYTGLPRTVLTAGWGDHIVNYVNANLTASTNANENDLFAKARIRLTKRLTANASATHWWTNDQPIALSVDGQSLIGPLVWSSKNEQKVDLSYSLGMRAGLSARVRQLNWTNSSFNTSNSLHEQELSGWWMPTAKLTSYLTILSEDFNLDGIPGSAAFASNPRATILGVTYQISKPLFVDASYTDSGSSGAQIVTQHLISVGMAYQLAPGTVLSARGVFDSYRGSADALDLGYDGTLYEIRLSKLIF